MSEGAPPEARIRPHRKLSLVWLIPLVALLGGVWVVYVNASKSGPEIQVIFRTAEGLEAGKTPIRYREVKVGLVEQVDVSSDLSHVVVTARLNRHMGEHLVEGTRFWIVSPRIGTRGISGLSTLVSGSYIAMDVGPGGGARAESFKGLEIPPIDVVGERGLAFVLEASEMKGLNDGAPLLYRDVNVGEIVRYRLDKDDDSSVLLHVLVRNRYAHLVNSRTRFWKVGGVRAKVGLGGVEVDVESLQALLVGGVAFDTFGTPGEAAKKGDRFRLYRDRKAVLAANAEADGLRIVLDAPHLGSIQVGDPLLYREETVGHVVGQALHEDARSVGVFVSIQRRFAPLVRTNSVFWNASGIEGGLGWSGVTVHTESLEALLRGGVAFATPNEPGPPVKAGSVFALQAEGKSEWRSWSPRIWIGGGVDPLPTQKVASSPVHVSPLSKSGRSERYRGSVGNRGMKR